MQFVLVSRRGPLGRLGVGELDLGDLLVQGMILAISLGGTSPQCYPILAQSEWRDRSDSRSWVSSGLVRRSLCSLSAGLSHAYSSCQPDSTPGEGCLTEVWLEASGHTRWRNEVVHRGNHHYGEGRQRLWTPPPLCRETRASGTVPLSGSLAA